MHVSINIPDSSPNPGYTSLVPQPKARSHEAGGWRSCCFQAHKALPWGEAEALGQVGG